MMGLISVLTAVKGSVVGKVLDTVTAGFAHPVQTISAMISPTKTVAQVVKKHFEQPLSTQMVQTLVAGAVYAGAALASGAVAAKGVVGLAPVVKALIPTTIKGKIIAAAVAPIVLTAIIEKPSLLGKVAEYPTAASSFTSGVINLIEEPSVAKAKELYAEHPVLTGVTALGAGALIGGGIGLAANTVATMFNTKETKENTLGGMPQTVSGEIPTKGATIPEKEIQTAEGYPATAQTQAITTGKKRYRRSRLQEKPSVRQNVQVILNSRAIGLNIRKTENYLKERWL